MPLNWIGANLHEALWSPQSPTDAIWIEPVVHLALHRFGSHPLYDFSSKSAMSGDFNRRAVRLNPGHLEVALAAVLNRNPANGDLSAIIRKSSIFDGICCEFMHRHSYPLGRFRFQNDKIAADAKPIRCHSERRKLRFYQVRNRDVYPIARYDEILRCRQALQAACQILRELLGFRSFAD